MDEQREKTLRQAISYCIENNDVNKATSRLIEFIRDEEAITVTRCSLQLNAKINKEIDAMSEILKEVEDNEELFLKDKNEWYRQKNIAEGKIAILLHLIV